MNAAKSRQEARRIKISHIRDTLKKYNGLLKNEENELVLTLMSSWCMSERVVKEYLKVAKFEYERKKKSN